MRQTSNASVRASDVLLVSQLQGQLRPRPLPIPVSLYSNDAESGSSTVSQYGYLTPLELVLELPQRGRPNGRRPPTVTLTREVKTLIKPTELRSQNTVGKGRNPWTKTSNLCKSISSAHSSTLPPRNSPHASRPPLSRYLLQFRWPRKDVRREPRAQRLKQVCNSPPFPSPLPHTAKSSATDLYGVCSCRGEQWTYMESMLVEALSYGDKSLRRSPFFVGNYTVDPYDLLRESTASLCIPSGRV